MLALLDKFALLQEDDQTMRLPHFVFTLFLLLTAGLPARAASSSAKADQVQVELLVPAGVLVGDIGNKFPNDAGLRFKLEPGWHIYWKNPGDAGEPSHIKWTLPAGITAGPMQFPAPKRLPLGPLMDFGYEDEVLFPFQIYVAQGFHGGPVTLHAKVDWLVCRERCIPENAELEVQTKSYVGMSDWGYTRPPLFQRFIDRIPKPLPPNSKAIFQLTPTGFRLIIETGKRETEATFFPADPDIIDNPAPQKLTPTANGLILDLKKDAQLTANPAQLKGVLELSGGRAYEIVALPPGEKAPTQSAAGDQSSGEAASGAKAPGDANAADAGAKAPVYQSSASQSGFADQASSPSANRAASRSWAVLLRTSALAFLGGLLLNLMPCVFPVLFLKGLALVNSGNEERGRLRARRWAGDSSSSRQSFYRLWLGYSSFSASRWPGNSILASR